MLHQLKTQPALIDQVHEQLVAAIAEGQLQPGQRLTQETVAEMLGVSRQPVSHALQMLKRRGLVIEHGRRGVAVAPMDGTKIQNLYQVREALDGLAARLAAARVQADSAERDEIEALQDAYDAGASLGRRAAVIDLIRADVAFHRALHALSGNPEISLTVEEQWPQFMRSMAIVLDTTAHREQIWNEHQEILQAVLDGNAGAAEASARQHTRRAGEDTAARVEAAE
ncbi:MAG: GntR family transcriptional regulator [Pseudomonadota bacterium]